MATQTVRGFAACSVGAMVTRSITAFSAPCTYSLVRGDDYL